MTGADLSLERPGRHTELRAYAGVVPGDPDAVYAALVDRLAADGVHSAADAVTRRYVEQGDWWYRGEYRVLPDPAGSRVEYEIVNVAQRAHRMGAITARSVLREAPSRFAALLGALADDVGAAGVE